MAACKENWAGNLPSHAHVPTQESFMSGRQQHYIYDAPIRKMSKTSRPHHYFFEYLWCYELGRRHFNLLLGSVGSLESLTIGFEEEALHAYENCTVVHFFDDVGVLSVASEAVVNNIIGEVQWHAHNVSHLLTPESLRLTSFDFNILLEPSVDSFLDLSSLTTLTLVSRTGVIEALHFLTTRRDHYRFKPSQLRSLTIRAELSSLWLIATFEGFICSLIELTDLCILFESPYGGNLFSFAKRILSATGKLKTLIIEGGFGPRNHSSRCTSWPTSSELLFTICDSCPNLVELGMALDW